MKSWIKINRFVASTAFVALMAVPAMAEIKAPIKAHNVVLVHGLYADGSSWSEVIAILQKAGLHANSTLRQR
ncbi:MULTISPECIES: hypothetical protein [unclassified Rhizobium]|uniref:hypothetical protein n=1 Tax=unclassified Rhizobium TaxID=2613769 RepID=UPI0035A98C83